MVTARGGAEAALGLYYKTFLIYRTCMRRALARPVRACFVRSCCTDVVQEHDLRPTPVQGNAKRRLSAHFTLHTALFALHTPHFTLALHTSSHLKACELFSPHLSSSHLIPPLLTCHQSKSTVFISSEHGSTFLPPRSCSQLISAVLHARKLLLSERSPLHKKNIGRRKFLHTDT